jgi:DNA modification methylase
MSSQLLAQDYELVAIDTLHPHPDNPRRGATDKIARSVATHGFYGVVTAQRSTRYIVVGSHRWEAAKREGLEKIPVMWIDVDDTVAKKILLGDNRTSDLAGYANEVLATVLLNLRAQDSLEGTGYTENDVGELLKSMGDAIREAGAQAAIEVEEAPLPELPQAPVTQLGDKVLLGDNLLVCGDATKRHYVARLMSNAKAQFVFSDCPYACSYQGYTEERLTIEGDNLSADEFISFLRATFASYAAITLPTASLYVCHPSRFQREFQDAMEGAGFEIRCQIIWAKNTFAWGFGRYKFQHEPIFYAHRKGETDNWYGDKSQSTLWEVKKPSSNRLHPTMKPVELVQRALANSSRKGDLVVDLMGGAGSTLIACEVMKRPCRMMEIDPRYCDVIIQRWQKLTGKSAKLDSTGETYEKLSATRVVK